MQIKYRRALLLVCLQVSLSLAIKAQAGIAEQIEEAMNPSEQQQEDEDEDYDYNQTNSNDGLNGSRFESPFGNSGSRSIDYSTGSRYQEREFWSERNKPSQNFDQYYNQNSNTRPSTQYNQGNGGIVVGGGSQPGIQGDGQQTPGQMNVPSIKDPFQTTPGIKTPRNIDAVPDNGGDPDDVPVDGGVILLGASAIWLGRKKLLKK